MFKETNGRSSCTLSVPQVSVSQLRGTIQMMSPVEEIRDLINISCCF